MKALSNKSVIESYFKSFSAGDIESVLHIFHPDCLIVSVRDAARANGQLHGTYRTRNQAADFLANISRLFNIKSFEVETITEGDNNVVYANGTFAHEVKRPVSYSLAHGCKGALLKTV